MLYVVAVVLLLLNTLSFGLLLLRLPGIWLMVLFTGLAAWLQWDTGMFSPWTLGVILGLAILSEVLEFIAGAAGAKGAGGSFLGAVGATVGSVIGAIVGAVALPMPVIGSLVIGCVGAWLGAWGGEVCLGRGLKAANRSGHGAAIGTLAGALIKTAVGLVVWVIATVASFWP